MKCRECETAIQELDINQRFGKALAVLGEGTYGVVTLHNDLEKGGQVVVKSSRAEQPYEQLEKAVVTEISSLAALQGHPNIVKFIGCNLHKTMLSAAATTGTMPSWTAIVLEKADDSLDGYLRKGNFADAAQREKRRSFLHQILLGMDWMHKNGIWHRDLKPQNLLVLDGGERVAVTDFGLARGGPFQWVKLSNNVFSRWYRAPEVLIEGLVNGPARYGAPADVWSIGMVFWDLLTASGSAANPSKVDFLRGNDETLQIWKYFRAFPRDGIFEELGIDEKRFVSMMPSSINFAKVITPAKHTRALLEDALHYTLEDNEWDLLARLTRMNPSRRMTIEQALEHPYFSGVVAAKSNVPSAPTSIRSQGCGQFGFDMTMWTVVVDWMAKLAKEFYLQPASLFLGIHVLRCHLAESRNREPKLLQLQAGVALWLGALYQEDSVVADAKEWKYMMDDLFSTTEIVAAQKQMFLSIGARLHLPSSWTKLMEQIEQTHNPAQIAQIGEVQRKCLEDSLLVIEAMPSSFDLTETQIAEIAYDVCMENGVIRSDLLSQVRTLQNELQASELKRLFAGWRALKRATTGQAKMEFLPPAQASWWKKFW